ncbi:hypothetical protein [Streptomyces sp. N35]|nr:hypothetical protein [Streptomyces sp. N35]
MRADELNEQIRLLVSACPAVRLRPEQSAEYWRLVAEWNAAVRSEVVEAA